MTALAMPLSAEPDRLKLYQLPGSFAALERAIDDMDGELTDEMVIELDRLEMALEEKADAVAAMARQAEAEAAFFDAEARRLAARRSVAENRAASLKAYLHRTLTGLGRDRVDGRRFKVRLQKNSAPSIRWAGSIDDLPTEFRRVRVELDGDMARDAYRAGTLPPGFTAETGTHIRIR